MNNKYRVLVLNLPGQVLKSGSRWYNVIKKESASLRYYPYPWFMGYLTSLLKTNKYDAVLKDAVALEWTADQARNYIKEYKPTHIVCEPTWVSSEDDKKFVKKLPGNIVKIAVGNYATNYPMECLAEGFDYVVVGEYEFLILDFLKSGGKKLPKNFVSLTKKTFEHPDLIEDLDKFPFPERDDTPIEYFNEPSCYGKNVVLVTSRGCRFNCGFCNVEAIYGRHCYRMRSPENVVDEIVELQKKYKFDEIYCDDDNMVARKSHVDGICREIIRRKVKVKFCCMGDARVDDETLELLAQAGCVTYKYGLEHLDKDVLAAIPKALDPERSLQIIKKCHELGIRAYANLIVGLPESNWDKDLDMLKMVFAARPDLIQIGIATPYPGTAFYKKSVEKGWLISKTGHDFDVTGQSVVSYPDYSAAKITEMFHLGWTMWYKNVILHQPKTLWFFFVSEVRRNGFFPTIFKSFSYVAKTLRRSK
ncbi:MAG: B12-binding domain-containing radical SAM protein [Candidatus Berkelbacteria bacterium]|nr:B12-binding domain-containing radical SAM protein [Candidatus Berkelbacteria bacterium]